MSKKVGYYSNIFTKINNAFLKNKGLRKIKNLYYYIDGFLLFFFSKKTKKQDCNKKRVAIIYNLSLGDGIIFMTTIRKIRKIYPEDKYEVDLYCQKGLNKMYEKLNVFDNIIPINFTGSTVNLKNRINTIKELRKKY